MDQPQPLELDGLTIRYVSGGRLWLDGGTMFGVVPKPLWARRCVPDERNRVELDCVCVLVQTGRHMVLIETGYGSNPTPRQKQYMGLREDHPVVTSLAALGVTPEQIDVVILTHLHFDHAGGCTQRRPDGTYVPTFPRARHIVQAPEWEDAVADLPELSGNYPPENFMALKEAGLVETVDGDATILPGVAVRRAGGHTRGHQVIDLGTGERKAVYLGDLCSTRAHLSTFWTLAYDQFLLETRRAKPRVLGEAVDRGWAVIFGHDPQVHGGYLRRSEKEDFVVERPIRLG